MKTHERGRKMTTLDAVNIVSNALCGYCETCISDEEEYAEERREVDEAWNLLYSLVRKADPDLP